VRPAGGVLAGLSDSGVLDQVQDGLYIVDRTRCVVYWNHAAAELTGFAAADVLGHPCHEENLLNHRSTLGQTLCGEENCPVLRAMLTGTSGTLPHLLLMGTRSGRPLPVSLSVGPLRNTDGTVVGAIVLFRQEREEYQQRRLATEIQKRMVTRGRFDRGRLRVHTLYHPVSEIGGDFIEAFSLDDGSLVATVADATGHGISAALFTMVYKTLLHATIGRLSEPARTLEEVNRALMRSAGVDGFFLSACLVRIDPAGSRAAVALAGHPPALLFAAADDGGRSFRGPVGRRAPALGLDEAAAYEDAPVDLAPGDLLFLATDGIFDTRVRDGSAFGAAGVERFLADYRGGAPLEQLYAHLRRECPLLQLPDDTSALAVEVLRE
jgi:phosphoserine phosphatase RsbU/P